MQKKLIALAVASLASGAALAQTNVTIYGVVDAGYVYSSGSAGPGMGTNTFSGIASGIAAGPRLGFKGEEALGNGLKAVFTLEYALNIDGNYGIGNNGADGSLNARQQFVGLSSDKLGTVALGRQYAPGFNAAARNDALDATDMSIQSSLSALSNSTITPNSPARFDNSITYTSATYSGFTGSAIYGFGEAGVTNSTSDNGKFGLGGNYANGPVNVDLVYQSRQKVVTTIGGGTVPVITGNGKDVNEWYVGGNYDFKVVKAFASYQALNNKNATSGEVNDSNLWTLGVSAPVGPGTLALSYGKLSLDKKNASDGDSWGAGTMYTYPLSKRTAVYAAYSYFSNDNNSLASQAIIVPGGVGAIGESNYTVGGGLVHSF
ncbi:MAG: Outer membrane porin protein 32 precursor [Candidatus Accumulibacter regalis]|jgi:predicted porin|uniref:Outer membrane porin protein 32 n=1 Tax=Accumulibacter regalis TaxID=522306 RepID=A0A011QII5_ACCRE|nr:porin [Accumulibacter sp.]EXI88855.1 MAG: Outer membrane porin protein 32 precursor [Candidatus Accumulibacter regalis]MQM34115.1 porin [Candidatus Accumulibacter phosphatis]MBL8368399.1 porin [Accumulibacter sp.]HRE69733.1 porin [Accumulibacter sp.]HRE85069.1 porin [Accumulibacter sp.]